MARELQDLCHSDPDSHAKRERLPACRKLRVEADGVAEPSEAVSYERRIHVRPTGRGDNREHRPTRARRVRRRMRRRFRGAGPPSLAAEEGKPHCFGTCAMSGTAGPPGSWSDYNHYEVSVTVANPRAVFGRDAIDMMGSIQSIATKRPGVARGASGSILAFHRSIQGRSGRNGRRSPRSGHLFEQRRCATSEPEGI